MAATIVKMIKGPPHASEVKKERGVRAAAPETAGARKVPCRSAASFAAASCCIDGRTCA
jgi:hypothetical protein